MYQTYEEPARLIMLEFGDSGEDVLRAITFLIAIILEYIRKERGAGSNIGG